MRPVWREIDSEEAQPQAAFLEALSRLVGRWLMARSDAPAMDVVTVLCKARGYYRTPGGARMEKLIRFIATPLCQVLFSALAIEKAARTARKHWNALSGRAPLCRTRDPMTQTRNIMGSLNFFRKTVLGSNLL
jgi:hypothetical protein